jgi:hypothetical protein
MKGVSGQKNSRYGRIGVGTMDTEAAGDRDGASLASTICRGKEKSPHKM